MYYYAHINECSLVDAKYAFDAPTTETGYVEITEDQYYNLTLGFMYMPDTNTFEEFYWSSSTNEINYPNTYIMLTHIIDEINEDIANKADINHIHTGYASSDDLQVLEDVVDTKADATHIHTGYASSSHTHDNYATQIALDTLEEEVSGKADSSHIHSDYVATTTFAILETEVDGKADASHIHSNYAETTHNHNADYADINHNHDSSYSSVGHDHDEDYAAISHSHSNYATVDSVNELSATMSGKANASHSHDDRYYTETEVDTLLSNKANSSHTHTIANVTNLQSTLDGKASSGHTHGAATTSASGFMTKDMVTKLNGIAAGANAYTLPTASSTLGGVKTTSTVTSTSGYTACPIISGVPYYKDTNTTYNLGSFGITATAAELNYVDGVTSSIQTQLNGKASSSHNHSGVYANASHSHTASAVGAIATGDIATVAEVEAYLGI